MEKYYDQGKPVSKAEYLAAGGQPADAPAPQERGGLAPGTRSLELFEHNGVCAYYVMGEKVDRKEWLQQVWTRTVEAIGPAEVQAYEKKAFGNIKNYLHNTLGLTRSHVEGMLKTMINDNMKDIIRELLHLPHPRMQADSSSKPFEDIVRATVTKELQNAVKSGSLANYVEKLCQEEIRKHVLNRLKVDIRVTSVDPENGVMREAITPEVYREAREL